MPSPFSRPVHVSRPRNISPGLLAAKTHARARSMTAVNCPSVTCLAARESLLDARAGGGKRAVHVAPRARMVPSPRGSRLTWAWAGRTLS